MNTFLENIRHVGPRDSLIVFVELLLIGFVVYITVSFLEGTRGERLFRGVISILIVGMAILYLVVKQFDLARVEYLYKGFLIAISIVAIAAFQPEIRRALIRIGQARFLSSSPQQLSRSVEEIVGAIHTTLIFKTISQRIQVLALGYPRNHPCRRRYRRGYPG